MLEAKVAPSLLFPIATPQRDMTVGVNSADLLVGRVDLVLDLIERVELAKQYRFGLTRRRFEVDIDRKNIGVIGPDVVRFHEAGDQIRSFVGGEVSSSWVVLSAPFVADLAADTPEWRAPFSQPFRYPALSMLAELHLFLRRAEAGESALWAQEAMAELLPRLLDTGTTPWSAQNASPGQMRLAKEADAILYEDFQRVESLTAFAALLGVSASYLARSYRAAKGATLHSKVTRLRVAEALRRLADGATDLTGLAFELGYSSHSHFSAEFRRYVGRPPSEFRLRAQI